MQSQNFDSKLIPESKLDSGNHRFVLPGSKIELRNQKSRLFLVPFLSPEAKNESSWDSGISLESRIKNFVTRGLCSGPVLILNQPSRIEKIYNFKFYLSNKISKISDPQNIWINRAFQEQSESILGSYFTYIYNDFSPDLINQYPSFPAFPGLSNG